MIGGKFDSFSSKPDYFDLACNWFDELRERIDALVVMKNLTLGEHEMEYVLKTETSQEMKLGQITSTSRIFMDILTIDVTANLEKPPTIFVKPFFSRLRTIAVPTNPL